MSDLKEFIKLQALAEGFDRIGIARSEPFTETQERLLAHIKEGLIRGLAWFTPERVAYSCDPANLLPQVKSIISLAISYHSLDINIEPKPNNPCGKVARYAWGQDYHKVLRSKMEQLFEKISEREGVREARFLVDTARIVDRAVGQRAGVGFFGKNTNLISKGLGSYFFLCEILTDLELEPDAPAIGTCGNCTRCLDACPTKAIVAPWKLDNDRCISYLTIEKRGSIAPDLRDGIGTWIFGCDICQQVCPYNFKVVPYNHPEFIPAIPAISQPELLEWLRITATEESFRAQFKDTSLVRTKRTGLRRNLAIALGNSGESRVLPHLYTALEEETDPEVREHLEWAIQKLLHVMVS
ncbi:MAG: tRNA epoxyqueuosine(34) reductase QueG [Chloroflexi bacterium]|uniref:tRNA epoxyqueuosine(34) reductase QueG n=1 Tax=Candidatus Chlorohelix allophototropha TaxID=3003348 RepID=A0A8T7M3Q3_9CHLR|nr:tRNA epoxyqueuosine(34) reductase QueG [Chloroflexota bacterium]WJW66035.1 tRNA epoxyqueuosine(34) reductase QueG [Chloroflexota bacterium L227-S17]